MGVGGIVDKGFAMRRMMELVIELRQYPKRANKVASLDELGSIDVLVEK